MTHGDKYGACHDWGAVFREYLKEDQDHDHAEEKYQGGACDFALFDQLPEQNFPLFGILISSQKMNVVFRVHEWSWLISVVQRSSRRVHDNGIRNMGCMVGV